MKSYKQSIIFVIGAALILSGCGGRSSNNSETITMMQIVDRNGINETISSPDRIARLEKNDFLEPQPYEKVVRVYKKDDEGKTKAKLTTYHDNGQLWQYLETLGGRACGVYKEWYPNGKLRMESLVIEGVGDLSIEAQTSWIFDQKSEVWAEDNTLLAEIFYDKGRLEGESLYYYPNGKLSKAIPYHEDLIEGLVRYYTKEGDLVGLTPYVKGKKEGSAFFKGNEYIPKREEEYEKGRLMAGKYWNFQGELISEIVHGSGIRPIYEEGILKVEHEYRLGLPEGEVRIYRDNGSLESKYTVIEGKKQGEEWCYYDTKKEGEEPKPMLLISWKDDEVNGIIRTWYENGNLESEKEMAVGKKQGVLLAWYLDGGLMLVEEYEGDMLITGKYLKQGEDIPTSRVVNGSGIATIFDPEGHFIKKIEYRKGAPFDP